MSNCPVAYNYDVTHRQGLFVNEFGFSGIRHSSGEQHASLVARW